MNLRERTVWAFILATLVLILAGCSTSKNGFEGIWVGASETLDEDTSLVLFITENENGFSAEMTLPDIGVAGWPASSTRIIDDTLNITLPSDSGQQMMVLKRDGSLLVGYWADPRFEELAYVNLHLDENYSEPSESRVQIIGPAGKVGASLIMPEGEGPFPAVVFLHGSGPQPRDSSRFAAQTLAKSGIAAVLFDKRGVGETEGDYMGASFTDLAADGIAVARFVNSISNISGVGFFGHSQGGWISPLAAVKWPEAAFAIASAGPAVPPSREAEWEVVRQLRLMDAGDDAEEKARRVIAYWHDGIREGDWTAFDAALEKVRSETWFEKSGLGAFGERPSEAFIASYRAFMDYDPLPTLASLDVPFLAILAPEDESIDSLETESILRHLADERADITLKIYPGYDHTMRKLGPDGTSLRFPEHPSDYFEVQVEFIKNATDDSQR